MRILWDHGTPALAELDNGALIKAADGSFDIFITTDQNLRYQQNLAGRKLAVMVLRHLPEITAAIEVLEPGGFHEVVFGD